MAKKTVKDIDLKDKKVLVRVEDRKSVVQGKSVDLGGRRIIKKKKYGISELGVC